MTTFGAIQCVGDLPYVDMALARYHLEGPHHLVVFVFQNVAVPHVAAHVAVEPDDEARDHLHINKLAAAKTGQRAIGLTNAADHIAGMTVAGAQL